MKKSVAYVLCIAVGVVLGWTGNNLYNAKSKLATMERVQQLEAESNIHMMVLEQVRKQSEEEIAQLRGMIDSAATIIANYEGEIEDLKDQAEYNEAQISDLLTAEVQDLIDRYPALKSYTLALSQQIETQGQIIFRLEQKDLERVKVIQSQEKQIQLEQEIASTWKRQYEEQQLLLAAVRTEFDHYRRGRSGQLLLGLVGGGVAGFLGGVVFH